jgi:AcrR family transcriptional regulator
LVQKTQASPETEDLRVRRTRKMLQDALIALTVEKGFAAVTVRDITERAMVNRSTFYRHYLDKYGLLEQLIEELAALVASSDAHMEVEERENPGVRTVPVGLVRLLTHIQEHADFYRVMLGANGDTRFIQWFRSIIEDRFRYIMNRGGVTFDPKGPPLEMRLSFISCGDIGAILWWLETAPERTPEGMALMISEIAISSAGFSRPANPPVQN